MKDFLEKRFRHRTWFKEGVTVGFALDYFAKTSDFYLNKKPALKQSGNLLDAIIYDDTIITLLHISNFSQSNPYVEQVCLNFMSFIISLFFINIVLLLLFDYYNISFLKFLYLFFSYFSLFKF